MEPEPDDAGRRSSLAAILQVKKWPTDYKVYTICGITIVAMLFLAGLRGWTQLTFLDASIPKIFASMLLVSLFVERVIEVFVSVWVDRESAGHEQNFDYWQGRQGKLAKEVEALIAERNGDPKPKEDRINEIDESLAKKREQIDTAVAYADVESKALLPFAARTLKVSTWVGLVVGVLASAAGFRFLGQLVELPTDRGDGQYQCFIAADILLTGAVLAGGSKLIHNIFSVYGSFMSSTSKALSDQSKTQ